jgi:hypothetical protein
MADASLLVAVSTRDARSDRVGAWFLHWLDTGTELHAPELALYEVASGITRLATAPGPSCAAFARAGIGGQTAHIGNLAIYGGTGAGVGARRGVRRQVQAVQPSRRRRCGSPRRPGGGSRSLPRRLRQELRLPPGRDRTSDAAPVTKLGPSPTRCRADGRQAWLTLSSPPGPASLPAGATEQAYRRCSRP